METTAKPAPPPLNLYPPDVFPTATMAQVFQPDRARAWQTTWDAPPVSAPVAIRQEPSAAPVARTAPSPPQPVPTPAQPMRHVPRQPLKQEQVNAIVDMVRARPSGHPRKPQGGSGAYMTSFMTAVFTSVRSQDVTLDWLIAQGVTLRELVTMQSVRLTVSDLISAGILRTFNDLLQLDFQSADLTLRRECFNCSHLVQFFDAGYALLAQTSACGGFSMQTLLMASPNFTCDDLQTLGVRAQHLVIDDNDGAIPGFDFKLLGMVGLGPRDWYDLGLEGKHLLAYGITPDAVRRKLFWNAEEVARVFDLPATWLAAR